jgi:L-ascorbate metabolism protein UlaG (beta-lactamase superfamily)
MIRIFAGGAALALLIGAVFGDGKVVRPVSDHFDGKRFHNPEPLKKGFIDLLKWGLSRKPGPWPKSVDAAPGPVPMGQNDRGNIRITLVHHATVLIQMDGLNILTDPHWSDRASPIVFGGLKRVRPVGIRFEDLPKIHAVLISHDHYDHMDLPTLLRLQKVHSPKFFAGLGSRSYLEKMGISEVHEMDWWDDAPVTDDLRVHFVPANHFAARGIGDINARLWGGFVIEGPSGRVFFAGDTGWSDHFLRLSMRFKSFRVALLPIGAYLPRWFMSERHIDPMEAVHAHKIISAQNSIAIHHSTFQLADDGYEQPVKELLGELDKQYVSRDDFLVLDFGKGHNFPAQ